jgi:hypothetical protein
VYTDNTVLYCGYAAQILHGAQAPHVLIVTVPPHCGVYLYHTSGVLTELPHGVGIVPGAEGVAQIVVPHAAGVPAFTAIAFMQRSFGGGVVVCCARNENQPIALAAPATRTKYACPATAGKVTDERRPQALSLQDVGVT